MSPVAPPTKNRGFIPKRLSLLIMIIETRFPTFTEKYQDVVNLRWDHIHNRLIYLQLGLKTVC